MTEKLKKQAKALRTRLLRDGVDIRHGLALECIAAVHGQPNWDTLSAKGPSTTEKDEVPFHFHQDSQSGRAIRTIIGDSGSGKTVIAHGIAHFASACLGWTVVWIDPSMLGPDELDGWIAAKREQILAAQKSKLLIVFDEVWYLERNFERSEVASLFGAAFEREADIIAIGQAARDLEFLTEPAIAERLTGPNRRALYAVDIRFPLRR